jgi:outer membrane lipoprotein-sorting protein
VATAAVAADVAPASNLTAAQIVEKNVAARGGLAAWRAINTMTMSGQMDAGGKQDAKLPFVMNLKRPHKSRLEIRFQDQAAVQVYDGAQGWKVRPFLGRNEVEPYTSAEAKSATAWEELDGPLIDHVNKGTKVELVGTEAVQGKSAYKLKLTMKGGEQRNLWVDATSFLELKIEGQPRKIDGRMRDVAIYYRDYRTVQGLAVPHVLETAVKGVKQTYKITIQTVTVNQPLDDSLFAKPQLAMASSR